MLLQAVSACLGCSLLYVLWEGIRHYVVPSTIDKIGGPPRESLLKGNLNQLFAVYAWDWHREIVQKYGNVVKLRGWFGVPWLYITDPKAIHTIVVKDQYVFEETSWFIETNKLVFGDGLLATLGDHHRKQRKLLNPVFSINHMRDIIPIFYPITHKLRDAIATQVKQGKAEIDMLYWMSRAALEFIGQAGLGYSFDDLSLKDSANPYTVAAKNFQPTMARLNIARQYLPLAVKLVPGSLRRFLGQALPFPYLQRMINLVDTMTATAKDVYDNKQSALARGDKETVANVGQGKDIMSVLMRANASASAEDRLPESEVLGQMNTFLFAGSDTTSSALARILCVLAEHQEAQTRLREEVTEARQNYGDLMYDELTNLPFLDAVCRETLRLHAPVSFVQRTARKDAVLPLSRPIMSTSGELLHEIAVEKGTHVVVGILAANRDQSIWGADASEWRPERWLEPLPKSVDEAHLPGVYSNMMTFLGGGRACIGFKFSQLEMKVVLSVLLESFVFESSGQDIIWSMPGIATPTTRGNENKMAHLPLKVSLYTA